MWIIEDWMGNRVFPDKSFDSFESARDNITEHAYATAGDDPIAFDGICEDLYAVQLLEEDS